MPVPTPAQLRTSGSAIAAWEQRLLAGTHSYVANMVVDLGGDDLTTTYFFRKEGDTMDTDEQALQIVGMHDVMAQAVGLLDDPRVSVQAYRNLDAEAQALHDADYAQADDGAQPCSAREMAHKL